MKSKLKTITGDRIQKLPTHRDQTFESGRLVAACAGKENGEADYDITVFRRVSDSQRPVYRFEAADIEHLARLAHHLAAEVSEDRLINQELRDDLGCLAASLEPVFCRDRVHHGLYCRQDGNVWNLLNQLLIDELQLSEMSFRDAPHGDHPYRRLVALDLWIRGIGPRDGFNLPELDPAGIDDYFGGCPLCGESDGYLNMWREHWFYYRNHHVRWTAGENLFSSWRYEEPDDWNQTLQDIGHFIEVVPMCNPKYRHQPV